MTRLNVPLQEKTGLHDFRPGLAQTELYSHEFVNDIIKPVCLNNEKHH